MAVNRSENERLLIDYLLGRCEADQADAVADRLAGDGEFRKLHDDVRNTLAAMRLMSALEPPAGLADRTIRRIRQVRSTEAIIAREEISRPAVSRRTFSLRDLVATVAAVIIVGVVLFATGGDLLRTIRGPSQAAMMEMCQANQQKIGQAIGLYADENAGYLPVAADSQQRWMAASGEEAVSNSQGLYKLIQQGYAPPEVFQCPATGGHKPSKLTHQAGMVDFPAREFVNYSYQYAMGKAPSLNDPAIGGALAEMAILADSNPLFQDGRFVAGRLHSAVSDNHRGRGQNVLYLAGNVKWNETAEAGVGGNNIYLADGIFDYTGDETPANSADTFLLPAYSQR